MTRVLFYDLSTLCDAYILGILVLVIPSTCTCSYEYFILIDIPNTLIIIEYPY
jgi:hypothetical protein